MPDEPFTNRELKEMFKDIRTDVNEIKVQTQKTNGRVTELEKWKYASMGATGILSVVVVPILAWALWVLVNINQQVYQAVDDALSAYNISR